MKNIFIFFCILSAEQSLKLDEDIMFVFSRNLFFGIFLWSSFACEPVTNMGPCDEVFKFNQFQVVGAPIPYMKTCGLDVKTAKQKHDSYSNDMSVDQGYTDVIYDELEIADKILTRNKIPYFAVAGTLIGIIRNGGLIPNDDDADIGFDEKYEEQLMALAPVFEKNGFELNATKWPCGSIKVIKIGTNSNGLDIFPMKKRVVNGEERYAYARDCAFGLFPNEYFPPSATDNLIRRSFGHLQILSVSDEEAIPYLDRAYGKDWYIETYKTFDHVAGKPVKKQKVKLKPEDYYYLKHSTKTGL